MSALVKYERKTAIFNELVDLVHTVNSLSMDKGLSLLQKEVWRI